MEAGWRGYGFKECACGTWLLASLSGGQKERIRYFRR